jgi:hypothetical protein
MHLYKSTCIVRKRAFFVSFDAYLFGIFCGISECQNFYVFSDCSLKPRRCSARWWYGRRSECGTLVEWHWWENRNTRKKGCPRAAVSITHLTWAVRPITVRRVVDTVAVRVLRLPLSVGRTDISGDCGVLRLRLWLTVPKPPTKVPVTRTEE